MSNQEPHPELYESLKDLKSNVLAEGGFPDTVAGELGKITVRSVETDDETIASQFGLLEVLPGRNPVTEEDVFDVTYVEGRESRSPLPSLWSIRTRVDETHTPTILERQGPMSRPMALDILRDRVQRASDGSVDGDVGLEFNWERPRILPDVDE